MESAHLPDAESLESAHLPDAESLESAHLPDAGSLESAHLVEVGLEANRPSLAELRAVTYKKRDSWWTVLFVDPLAIHLVRVADRIRWATPNRITLLAFVIGLAGAGCFLAADPVWLIIGAVLYHVAFVLDCVDGKLARWQKSGSVVGGWLDFTLDQVRLVICAVALLGGQYLASGTDGAGRRGVFLLLAAVVVFLNMFRYFNGFLMERALFDLRDRLDPAGAGQRRAPSISDDDPADQALDSGPEPVAMAEDGSLEATAAETTVPAGDADPATPEMVPPPTVTPTEATPSAALTDGTLSAALTDATPSAALTESALTETTSNEATLTKPSAGGATVGGVAFGGADRSPVGRLRDWLTARRIRLNVYSGIEFQMVVLIAAPLAGAIAAGLNGGGTGVGNAVLGVTIAACVVMAVFELIQTARFLRSARGLTRAIADAVPADGDVPVQRPANPAEGDRTQR